MLHTKIVDSKEKKLSINDAERFISSVEFGASIFFTGTVGNLNNNKLIIINQLTSALQEKVLGWFLIDTSTKVI